MPPVLFAFLPLWGTVLIGAGAVAVPVVIHLLSRRRYKVVTWAAMRFLLAAQKQNTRRLRLEQLILLLIRAGIVTALLLAMASVTPWAEAFWQWLAPGAAGFGGGRAGRTHLIIVLDGSLSMAAAEPGGKSSFEKARDHAEALINGMQSGDAASILLMKDTPVWVVGEPSQDAKKLLKELKALRLPHGNSSVPATLNSLAAKLRDSPDRFDTREVYFLTDLQHTTWIPDLPSEAGKEGKDPEAGPSKEIAEIQKRARTIFVDVGRDNVSNAAVTGLALNDPLVTTNATVTFTAQVKNFGPRPKERLNISLRVGRWTGDAAEPTWHSAAVEPRSLQAGEQVTVNFAHKFTAAGTYAVQVAIDADELRQDDSRTVIVTVKDHVAVLVVDGKPSPQRFDRAGEYLAFALNPWPANKAPAFAVLRPKVVSLAQFSDANQTRLGDYDCVFLCDVGPLAAGEVRRLEGHVRKGGGLVVSCGDNVAANLEVYNRLLFKKDQGLLPARLIGVEQAPPDHYFVVQPPEGFGVPPLKAFSDQADQTALGRVRFHQYLRAQLANDPAAHKLLAFMPEALAGAKEATTQHVGDAAVVEWNPPAQPDEEAKAKAPKDGGKAVRGSNRLRGKVLLITSTVNMDWTTWPGSPSFMPLVQELTRFAVSGRLREQAAVVGGVLEEPFGGGASLEGSLYIPGEFQPVKVRTLPSDDVNLFRFFDTDQSGVYRLTLAKDSQDCLFAVNVPTETPDRKGSESDLARTDKIKLKASYPGWDPQFVKELSEVRHGPTGQAVPDGETAQAPDPIGPFVAEALLAALVALLFLEIILACTFGHFSASARALGQTPPRPRIAAGAFAAVMIGVGVVLLSVLAVAFVEYQSSGDFLGFLIPDVVRGGVESWLDVPPPASGESTAWTLRGGAPVGPHWVFSLLGVLVMGLALMVVVITTLFEARSGASLLVHFALGTLSLLIFGVVVFWLWPQPQLVFERQTWPDVVVLIDDSLSMGGVDPYRSEEAREPVKRLEERYKKFVEAKYPEQIQALKTQLAAKEQTAQAKDEAAAAEVAVLKDRLKSLEDQLAQVAAPNWRATRLQLAQSILLGSDPDFLTTLSKKNRLKIHIFHLDAQGRALKLTDASGPAGEVIEPKDLARAQKAVAALKPTGTDSQLGSAVRQVIDYYRGSTLSGIVMFTDGVTTRNETLLRVAEYAGKKGVPLFFVGIGEDEEAREIELTDLQVDDPVFVNDRLIFEVKLKGVGYKDKAIPVLLKVKEGDVEKEILPRIPAVKLDPKGGAVKVQLKHQPTEAGKKRYIIEAQLPKEIADELPSKGPTRRIERDIFVEKVKKIQILYIEGSARYDYRYVKNLLARESAAKKSNQTMELNVLLVDSDDAYAKEDKTALATFPPSKDELYKYNVIIFGDVDPYAPKLGEPRLRDIADFVKDHGGGLLVIAGSQYMPHAYKDTPLAAVLPVEIGKGAPDFEDRVEPYRLELTPAGQMHPIFRFVPDEADNKKIWQNLAPMYWWAENYRPKPLAEVLAVHPRAKAPYKVGKGQDDRMPLVVQQFNGAGRTMFLGFDESWRWRFREDELRFNQFWIQTMRYLSRSKLTRTELRLDRQSEYQVNDPIKVTVRFPDLNALQSGKPDPKTADKVKVVVTVEYRPRDGGPPEISTLQLAKVPESFATYEAVQTSTREGEYRFWLSEPSDVAKFQPDGEKPSAVAKVVRPPGETEHLRFHRLELIQAAAASRSKEELKAAGDAGRSEPGFYTVATADKVLEDLSLDTVAAYGQVARYAPRPPWPVWNLFAFVFLPLVLMLTAVWVLRKSANLL
jgi:hypothetical protein